MISQETLDALKGIGLNLYERKIYAALLAKGTSTVSELSEMSNVPRSRGYDVLESLAEKGFIVTQHAKPIKFVAMPPEVALEKQKTLLKESFMVGTKRIEDFKVSKALEELSKLYKGGVSTVDPSEMNGSFKGAHAQGLQVDAMIKSAKGRVDMIATEQGLMEIHKTHAGALKKAQKRGVSLRIVAQVTDKNNEAFRELGKIAEIRSAKDRVPVSRMFLTDTEALVGLTGDEVHPTQHVSFWTKSDHFTQGFAKSTFEMLWNSAGE